MSMSDYDAPIPLDDDFRITMAEAATFLDLPIEQVRLLVQDGILPATEGSEDEPIVQLRRVIELCEQPIRQRRTG